MSMTNPIIVIVQSIIIIWMVLWYLTKKQNEKQTRQRNKRYELENYQTQVKRLKSMRARCNKYLHAVPSKLQQPDRMILVSYEDLIMLWDSTNHVEDHL